MTQQESRDPDVREHTVGHDAAPAGSAAVEPAAAAIGAIEWIRAAARMAAFGVALFWPSGTWRWWEAWAVLGLWVGFGVVTSLFLLGHDRELLAERMKGSPTQQGQKTWDKVLMLLMFAAGIGIFIVPGLDVMRFGWSDRLPVSVEILAMAVHVPCFLLIGLVLRENTYLSRVVKIDAERGHHIITTGPYAIVRHPMYAAIIPLVFALPLALGSRFALIPAAAMAALLIVRTHLEDGTLHRELPGYPEYARETRYRLIPGVW